MAQARVLRSGKLTWRTLGATNIHARLRRSGNLHARVIPEDERAARAPSVAVGNGMGANLLGSMVMGGPL